MSKGAAATTTLFVDDDQTDIAAYIGEKLAPVPRRAAAPGSRRASRHRRWMTGRPPVLRPGLRASTYLVEHLLRSSLSIAFLICATAAAQPALFILHSEIVELGGHDVQVDVYEPGDEPSDGVAIVAHGFTRSRARHRDLGQALAAAGVTAVVPDLPYVLNHWGNGDAIEELAHKLAAGALGMRPIEQSRLVLIGTSAGGLATVLAAANLPELAGWVGLDPVDRTGSGVHAASRLTAPAVVLLADPSSCNLFGSGRSIARAVPRLLRTVVLSGASHCDFEGPTNKLCQRICGRSSTEMQARAREETVRAVLEMLRSSAARPADGAPEFAR
jgi:dienelactone hydrolase